MNPRTIAAAALLVCCLAAAACGCAAEEEDDEDAGPTPTSTAPPPPVAESIPDLLLFDGWTNPRRLADPVNTSGWEDSSFISPDGETLYFGYTRFDYTLLVTSGQLIATGPQRTGQIGDAFDIYEATIEGGAWNVTNSSVNDPADVSEAAQGVDAGPTRMAFVRFENTPNYNPNLYTAEWDGSSWINVVKLPAPMNTDCKEDNAHLSADGRRLYWDSNRSDVAGTTCEPDNGLQESSIWTSTWDGKAWSTPAKVAGQDWVSPVVHWQPFEDPAGENLYWSGGDPECLAGCLYKAALDAGGAVSGVERVMRIATNGLGHVNAIGEMSITADGRYLYFTYGIVNSAGTWDLSIGVASR